MSDRGSGRSKRMCELVARFQREFPDKPVMVLVHSERFTSYLKPLAAHCGVDVARVQFCTALRGAERIRGQNPGVFFDHAIYEHELPLGFSDAMEVIRRRRFEFSPLPAVETEPKL